MDNILYELERLIDDNLEEANERLDLDSDEYKQSYKNAMAAIDRYIQIKRIGTEEKELTQKLEIEKEKFKIEKEKFEIEKEKCEKLKEEQNFNRVIRIIEVAAVPVGLFVLDCLFKRYYMRQVCNFEKDYTFTTTPGRSISGLFKFKK